MASITHSTELGARRERVSGYPATSVGFDWLIAVLGFVTVIGVFVDGWAHNSFPNDIESFLTPWHAALYGGVLATGTVLGTAYLRNLSRGYGFIRSLPKGYLLSLIGFAVFGMSGGLDFVWHEIFGFEVDAEALLSPAHLALATGAILMITGPLRSAWMASGSDEHRGWRLGPAILSLLAVMSIATFFTQFANVVTHAHNMVGSRPYASDQFVWQTATISYVLIPAATVMLFVLFAVHRWKLPAGAFTVLLTGNALLMFSLSLRYNGENWPILIGALAGGITADVLYATLKPSAQNIRGMRIFATLVPFLFFLLLFIPILLTEGMWWRVHMWLGAPVLTGVIGLGMSLLTVPPVMPQE